MFFASGSALALCVAVASSRVKNAENACKVVRQTVAAMSAVKGCKCGSALAHAILTDRDKIPPATRKKLSLILDKYLESKI